MFSMILAATMSLAASQAPPRPRRDFSCVMDASRRQQGQNVPMRPECLPGAPRPAPPPPSPPRAPQGAPPRLIAGAFDTSDYPAQANGATGITQARVGVGANGRVVDCYVFSSSGNAALDNATCQIIRARFRFEPARSLAGGAIAGTHTTRVSWTLPPAPTPARLIGFTGPEPARHPSMVDRSGYGTVLLEVDAQGRPTRCRILSQTWNRHFNRTMCTRAMTARFEPSRHPGGNPVTSVVQLPMNFGR